MAYARQKKPCLLHRIWGVLLNGLLTFLAVALELSDHTQLLEYVCGKSLSTPQTPEFKLCNGELQLVYVYQMAAYGKRHAVQFSPPNHESALLHWKTLINVISVLPEEAQHMVQTYESSSWQNCFCQRTAHCKSTSNVPQSKVLQFRNCIAITAIGKLLALLKGYPQLVYTCFAPLNSGVVTNSLLGVATDVLARLGASRFHREMCMVTTLLLLHGAPINHRDDEGCTAVHRAVLANNLNAVKFLITWDADLSIENNNGDTANALAQAKKYWVICDTLASANRPVGFQHKACTSTKKACLADDSRKSPTASLADKYGSWSVATTQDHDSVSRKDTSDATMATVEPVESNTQIACPLCKICYTRKDLKYHICIEHLPWYIGLKYSTRGKTKPTNLAKRLMPVYSRVFDRNTQYSVHPVFDLGLGKLLNGLLKRFAKAHGLDRLEDLVQFVNDSHLCPSWIKYEDLLVDEVLLIRSHRSYKQRHEPPSKCGVCLCPVNCVSAVLHWYTLACLLARLPTAMWDDIKSYERYTSYELVEIVPRPIPNDDTSAAEVADGQFHHSIVYSNIDQVWLKLSQQPEVASIRFSDKCGTTPLQLALDNSRYVIATLLLLCGASVDKTSMRGHTALKVMVQKNNLAAVRFLLNWKPKAQIDECYQAALEVGHTSMCQTLRLAFPEQVKAGPCRLEGSENTMYAAGDTRMTCIATSPGKKLRSLHSAHDYVVSPEGDSAADNRLHHTKPSKDEHPGNTMKVAGQQRNVISKELKITIGNSDEGETRKVAGRLKSDAKNSGESIVPNIDRNVSKKRKANPISDEEGMAGKTVLCSDCSDQSKTPKLRVKPVPNMQV